MIKARVRRCLLRAEVLVCFCVLTCVHVHLYLCMCDPKCCVEIFDTFICSVPLSYNILAHMQKRHWFCVCVCVCVCGRCFASPPTIHQVKWANDRKNKNKSLASARINERCRPMTSVYCVSERERWGDTRVHIFSFMYMIVDTYG